MIQDISPFIYNNAYQNKLPSEDSYIMYFEEQSALIAESDGEIRFPKFSEWTDTNTEFIYLFSINDMDYFLANKVSGVSLSGFHTEGIRIFRNALPRHTSFAGITAFQLNNWYKNHLYCGKCGCKMTHDTKERMMYCSECRNMEYPKISPAVIVAVTDGDKLLLSKYARGTHNNYALIAGFTEIGETIEETVAREVMEEVGLHVKNIHYYKSQPWSFSDTLLLGFYAELDGEPTITLDKDELSEAVWISRKDISVEFDNVSLTNEMIIKFKNN